MALLCALRDFMVKASPVLAGSRRGTSRLLRPCRSFSAIDFGGVVAHLAEGDKERTRGYKSTNLQSFVFVIINIE